MRSISYISMIALISIVYAFLHIFTTDIIQITNEGTPDITLKLIDLAGIPYFYGIASFMFEGNAV
jgi:hypothetical protein